MPVFPQLGKEGVIRISRVGGVNAESPETLPAQIELSQQIDTRIDVDGSVRYLLTYHDKAERILDLEFLQPYVVNPPELEVQLEGSLYFRARCQKGGKPVEKHIQL